MYIAHYNERAELKNKDTFGQHRQSGQVEALQVINSAIILKNTYYVGRKRQSII